MDRNRCGRSTAYAGRVWWMLALAGGLALADPPASTAQHEAHAGADLGVVDFGASCDAAVVDDFDRALALLHHMMYEEARALFTEISEREPGCAIAHWGIAMTAVQPLWYPATAQDLQRGWAALRRASELPGASERERALIAATEPLFRNPEEVAWWDRLRSWSEAMRELHRERPDDVEIAAFYALSEIAAGQPASDRAQYSSRAAETLLPIYERQPLHPGATHYMIHANDVAGREGESLDIVRGYDEIAPAVPHALHMPTHIFVRLGQWPEVLEWNRKSADAALELPVGGRVSMHYVHAMDYLVYAHLQRGEDGEAAAAWAEVQGQGQVQEHFASAFHLAMMPARLAVERRSWEEAMRLEPRTPEYFAWDRYPWAEALTWFARGLGAARSGELTAAREAEARMSALRAAAREAGITDQATYIEVDRLILSGWIEHAEGDSDAAIARMREAAEVEGSVQKHPVNPGALLPPYEALGDLLLELGRSEEALEAYHASLRIWPNRYNSLLGAARAGGETP